MKYCTKCLYPESKPDLTFDEDGVCSACQAFSARSTIDWPQREKEFELIVDKILKSTNKNQPYHCIIPVSGGKDSTYQIVKVKEYGLNPLAVTAITDDLSDIGNHNLHNISKLGCDHVFVSTNARVRRAINKYTLEIIGDISWAEHVTIFTVPIRESILRGISLIIYGENPQNEYGGPTKESQNEFHMIPSWLDEFGGLNGLRPSDIVEAGLATEQEMFQYRMPNDGNDDAYLNRPDCIFLGQYFEWDGYNNAVIASKHGFLQPNMPIEASGFYYENLDNYQTGIHDRFKYLKFGFGRATDMCCNHIRRGYMTRNEAIEHVYEWDSEYPLTYLSKKLEDILEPLDLTIDQYIEIENKFANPKLFNIVDGKFPIPKFFIE